MDKFIQKYYGYDIYKFGGNCSFYYYILQDNLKTFYDLSKAKEYINRKPEVEKIRDKERQIVKNNFLNTELLYQIPDGWKKIQNATTAPKGTIWVSNNKSYFNFDSTGNKIRKQALLIVDDVIFQTSAFLQKE